ncbi:MAG: hypothetical protein M3Z54_03200 [Gemmatimonadota bacterium]|nr:hypothetical protein [Gemmatimonadota bacterium]
MRVSTGELYATGMTAVTLLAAGVVGLSCASSNAPGQLTRKEAIEHAGRGYEGVGGISRSEEERVLGDPASLRLYSGILLGMRTWPYGADTVTMLYFLNRSHDKAYLVALLKYAEPGTTAFPSDTYTLAVFGLAYLAQELPARQRLEELGRDTKPQYRSVVADALAYVNSRAARQILRSLPRAGLPAGVQRLVEERLAIPDSVPM